MWWHQALHADPHSDRWTDCKIGCFSSSAVHSCCDLPKSAYLQSLHCLNASHHERPSGIQGTSLFFEVAMKNHDRMINAVAIDIHTYGKVCIFEGAAPQYVTDSYALYLASVMDVCVRRSSPQVRIRLDIASGRY